MPTLKDKLLDPNNNDIILFELPDGTEEMFSQSGYVIFDGQFYLAGRPTKNMGWANPGQIVIFKLSADEDKLEYVTDAQICKRVFRELTRSNTKKQSRVIRALGNILSAVFGFGILAVLLLVAIISDRTFVLAVLIMAPVTGLFGLIAMFFDMLCLMQFNDRDPSSKGLFYNAFNLRHNYCIAIGGALSFIAIFVSQSNEAIATVISAFTVVALLAHLYLNTIRPKKLNEFGKKYFVAAVQFVLYFSLTGYLISLLLFILKRFSTKPGKRK